MDILSTRISIEDNKIIILCKRDEGRTNSLVWHLKSPQTHKRQDQNEEGIYNRKSDVLQ